MYVSFGRARQFLSRNNASWESKDTKRSVNLFKSDSLLCKQLSIDPSRIGEPSKVRFSMLVILIFGSNSFNSELMFLLPSQFRNVISHFKSFSESPRVFSDAKTFLRSFRTVSKLPANVQSSKYHRLSSLSHESTKSFIPNANRNGPTGSPWWIPSSESMMY